jgi:general secretion pathway protein H
MPTSATGTSSKALRRFPAVPAVSGFTLLEVLVVVMIIGIISGMAVVSVNVLGGDHEMDQESARLQAILTQTREDAMLLGADVGLRIDARGYDFLRYDNRHDRWDPPQDDPLLRSRDLPDGMTATLRLEGRDVALKMRGASTERQPILPQVVVQASGDLVPFEVLLARDGTAERRRVTGTLDGRFEVHDDAKEKR